MSHTAGPQGHFTFDTTINGDNRADVPSRPPGRPYFEFAGSAQLAATLEAERHRDGFGAKTAGRSSLALVDDDLLEHGRNALFDLGRALDNAGGLFGPAVKAALAGEAAPTGSTFHDDRPEDRIARIGRALDRLDSRWRDADTRAQHAEAEVARLEHELAIAQGAFDIAKTNSGRNAAALTGALASNAYHEAYVTTIDRALERAVGHARAGEIRRRARRNAKAATTPADG